MAIELDKRNPFAAWGHEEIKYTKTANNPGTMITMPENGEGFNGVLGAADNKLTPASTQFTPNKQAGFFENKENTINPNVATFAYGFDKNNTLPREAGEPLKYIDNTDSVYKNAADAQAVIDAQYETATVNSETQWVENTYYTKNNKGEYIAAPEKDFPVESTTYYTKKA